MNTPEPSAMDGTLLAIIDMQPAFLKVIPGKESITRRCGFAIGAARLLGIPVAFTEQVPGKLGATDPNLLNAAEGSATIGKDSFSAFGAAEFESECERRGMSHLLLAGIETPICVFQTAVGALSRGLQVTLLSDCVGARRADDAENVLRYLAGKGCHILPSESVFYSILGGADHPKFREYTTLVKTFSQ